MTARATSSLASVQEGQPFTLDASTSTDTAGGTLSYSWTQTAGPSVTIASPTAVQLSLNATEVTADTAAQFKVTVTAGVSSAEATVDVTFANIAQTPVFTPSTLVTTATFPLVVTQIIANETAGFAGQPMVPPNTSFRGFTAGAGNTITIANTVAANFAPPVVIKEPTIQLADDMANLKLAVASEALDIFTIYRRNATGAPLSSVSAPPNFAIENPCAMSFRATGIEGAEGVYIGQRSKGFTLLKTNSSPFASFFIPTVVLTGGTTESLCAIAAPSRPLKGGTGFAGGGGRLEDVIALDVANNTINQYTLPSNMTLAYGLKQQVPIQLNTAQSLNLVAWTEIGPAGGPSGLAFVYSDGVHAGTHRLVIVGLDNNRNLVQETYSWPLGAPSDVVYDDLDKDGFAEVVVISSTSPQAIVFETNPAPGSITDYAPFAAPGYFEIGLGATSALPSRRNALGTNNMFVGYRDQKQIRVIHAGP